ncbi:MAG: hypothetical protein ABJB09_04755 [Verrucomicrobiota bacterium]
MINNKFLLVALIAGSIALPAMVRGQGIRVEIGNRDRAFYTHGPRYWEGESEMIWVPGHTWHHRWIHGHYLRGEHRRHGFGRHHDQREYRDGDRYEERREGIRY